MYNKKTLSFFIFYTIFNIILNFNINAQNKQEKILILPFINKGEPQLDYLGDLIQSTLYSFLNKVEKYDLISLKELNNYLKSKHYITTDLLNQEILFRVADNFNSITIIRGFYEEKKESIYINFEVISSKEKRIIYRYNGYGKSRSYIFETVDRISQEMVQDFTGLSIPNGKFYITADKECSIFINNSYYGKTPFTRSLPVGAYNLKVQYFDEESKTNKNIVSNLLIHIKEKEMFTLKVRVFVSLKIEGDPFFRIKLNNQKIDKLPYETKILSGQQYILKIYYKDPNINFESLVEEKKFSTEKQEDLSFYLSKERNLGIVTNEDYFYIHISKTPIQKVPTIIEKLTIGIYSAQFFLFDKEWNTKFYISSQFIKINPTEDKIISLNEIKYQKLWWLAFFPSALQFYNHDFIKGAGLLSLFTIGLLSASFSPLFGWLYYTYYYLPKAEEYNIKGKESGYTKEELNSYIVTSNSLFYGFLVGGIITLTIAWACSIVDGLIIMNRINKLLLVENKGIKIKFCLYLQ